MENSLPGGWENFNSVLQWRSREQADRTAFVYLTDGEVESQRLSFAELDQMAAAVAGWIKAQDLVGERVLLLYPPGLDFIVGLLGCLYAGAIAVPAYPPHPRRTDPRLEAIFDDCQPGAAFCIESDFEQLKQQLAGRNLQVLATDSLTSSSEQWHSEQITADSIAYLQYTSGSTGDPKGVVVTQGNLLYQAAYLTSLSGYNEQTVHVSWQPFFHDMGLVGSIIFPIFVGAISYIMAPAAFLRKPIRWLEAMSRYRGSGAPGPNFAFEICVTQTNPEEREGLDLSAWKVAWNGAEPIRPDTLNRFSEVYEPYGFDSRAHLPCYGMAETVLCTSADQPDRLPVIASFQRDDLEQNHAVPCAEDDHSAVQLVSSGVVYDGMDVAIVEPDTLSQCQDGYVGEIWVSGYSVAHGYWQKPQETEETFNAYIADSNKGPYLRTGDLGFIRDGELFVTGRLKDMIIIRGRNVYPQDIELIAQSSHQALQTDACAAFSIEVDGQEEIALAIEVKRTERRRSDFSDIFEAIRSAVTDNFGVSINWLGIIQPGRIPKTSSGKIMRRACRRDYMAGSLELLAEWHVSESEDRAESGEAAATIAGVSFVSLLGSVLPAQRHQILVTHLQSEIARTLDLHDLPDPQKGFERLGIDSMGAVKLVSRLQQQLDDSVELPTTLLFDQPNIESVVLYVEQAIFGRKDESEELNHVTDLANVKAKVGNMDAPELAREVDDLAGQVLGEEPWDTGTGGDDALDRARKSLATILTLQAELESLRARDADPIAVVGMSCRYPGGEGLEEFWRVLDEGQDAISEVPPDRWNIAEYYAAGQAEPGKINTRLGGFVSGVDLFDADFFDVSPREARTLDPQQRMLLEVAWEALENANMAPRHLRGKRGGVFVGISAMDYFDRVAGLGLENTDAYAGTGNALSAAAGRLAFTLGWQGPAMAIDTACSSSLVSLHQACNSLRQGDCDFALAGGVNLVLNPLLSVIFSRAQMLSPDGHCKTFDAAANGYVRGEGCGVVVLKRLSDAQRDGDRVLAMIRGSAVNQDGSSSGLTVPNGQAQEQVISAALAAAGIEPAMVQYLEAHGTGTSLGDPIEVQAANAVLSRGRDSDKPLLIGSVKTNIGHTESAAGIAGVIKVILALGHERIPQSLHFHEPNPHIPWDKMNVKVATESTTWPTGYDRRIAGVSSFGFVGTNAHVILEEAPLEQVETATDTAADERMAHLILISARNEKGLKALARRYIDHLDRTSGLSLADLCYTANTARDHFEQRAAMVFESEDEIRRQLLGLAQNQIESGVNRGRVVPRGKPQVAFLFTGQGAQSVGMGQQLYQTEPVFSEYFDRCAVEFAQLRTGAPDLRQLVFEGAGEGLLDQTGYTQPALYALEVSLFALMRSWGVEPDIVLGHSVGEYAAAYAAGVFSLEDGMRLISERGRLMQELPEGGGMAAVTADVDVVERAIEDASDVCIAAYNGADTVISGGLEEIDRLIAQFESEKIRCRRLITSHAFHSDRMEPILEQFRAFSANISYRQPTRLLVSNVSGQVLSADQLPDADYWTRHIRQPVQFERGIQALQEIGTDLLLEIGPHPVLVGMGQRCWTSDKQPLWIGTLRRERSDIKQILSAAGQLHVGGVEVDFAAMDAPWQSLRRKVPLPLYPFQHKRYWIDFTARSSRTEQLNITEHLYGISWQQRDVEPGESNNLQHEIWLILADEGGVGRALCRDLEESGQRYISLAASECPAGLAPALDKKISAELGEGSPASITHVVHLWALDRRHAQSVDELWDAQSLGVESVLDLLQELLDHQWQGRLWLVTSGVQHVIESDSVAAAQSPVWGLGKSIGMEHPEIWGGLLDLPQDADDKTKGLLTALSSVDSEDQVALRDGHRWVARLDARTVADESTPLVLEADASYLITGGLGGIGLELVGRMVQRGATNLVLCGRRAPSDKARNVIAELERRGCRVLVVSADVSLEEDVERLLDEIRNSDLPALKGIVHAAGVDTVVSLRELDQDVLRRTLAAKMVGGYLLDKLTEQRGIELSLFLCTSSISSVWGAASQGAYAASNAFLDALVGQRRATNRAATVINYGPWSKVGMGITNDDGLAWLKSRGITPLEPDLALDGMEIVVAANMDGTVVANINWSVFRELAELQRQRPFLERVGGRETAEDEDDGDTGVASLVSELKEAAVQDRADILKLAIKTELSRVLEKPVEELDDDVGFFDLGMDSLMAVELSKALSRLLGIKLSATMVMDRPDIDSVTTYLIESVLDLPGGKDDQSPGSTDTEESHKDATESEVNELSQTELESALDEELKEILGP